MEKESTGSHQFTAERSPEAIKKRWREACKIFYILHDKHYVNRSGKSELELKRARQRIIRRSLDEFNKNRETLINFPKFQIVLKEKQSESNLALNSGDIRMLLVVTRLKYLEGVVKQASDFLCQFQYVLVKEKQGEYLIKRA
jgi:hypothetical protein